MTHAAIDRFGARSRSIGRLLGRRRKWAVLAVVVAEVAAANSRSEPKALESGWPSYNRMLGSDRYSPLQAINRSNVTRLKLICSYDLGLQTSFQTGPIVIGGILYATSEKETFAVDAQTCVEKWRVREDVADSTLKVNRGAAYLDGRIFRGLQDGRVVAYDASGGKKLWAARIADPAKGESVPAAPIAWRGLVFIGNAGGDNYGVKGRMYALDAATGRRVWEVYLVPREEDRDRTGTLMSRLATASWKNRPGVPIGGGATWTSYSLDAERGLLYVPGGNPAPDFVASVRGGDNLFANSVIVLDARTGAYRRHFSLVPEDFHDWDVSAAPALFISASGRRMIAAAPKDGQLHAYDLADGKRRFVIAVTTRENVAQPLSRKGTRFCPGTQGGAEWNGPAFSPQTNLIYTGTVDWCATVRVANEASLANAAFGQPWSGSSDAKAPFGTFDPPARWAGWVTAVNADSGKVRWRYRTPAPILAAVTPTAGGLLFTADTAGSAYAFDSATGKLLWRSALSGPAAGGIITFGTGAAQRVAFVSGLVSPIWPVAKTNAKIEVFGVVR